MRAAGLRGLTRVGEGGVAEIWLVPGSTRDVALHEWLHLLIYRREGLIPGMDQRIEARLSAHSQLLGTR